MQDSEFPCPCDACDKFSLSKDEYCVTCTHHGCRGSKSKCPPAKRSDNWCDYCNQQKETVPARPEAEENRICGDCHPSGSLPDEKYWWKPTTCDECGEENPFKGNASCRNCGYIPPENRA